jgi:hypothetical protein
MICPTWRGAGGLGYVGHADIFIEPSSEQRRRECVQVRLPCELYVK